MVNFGNAPNDSDDIQDLWYALREAGILEFNGTFNGQVDGHFSADNHAHIHRHLGELYTTGYYWDDASRNTDYEIYIRNPADSGREIEILTTPVSAGVGLEIRLFKDFTWPDTGNTLTPVNFNSNDGDGINGDVEYGTDNADTGTLIPPVVVQTNSKNGQGPSPQADPQSDYEIDEGDVFALSVTPNDGGEISLGIVLAEYDPERLIE